MYSKGKLKMGRFEYEGAISRSIGFCIGAAILLLFSTPGLMDFEPMVAP